MMWGDIALLITPLDMTAKTWGEYLTVTAAQNNAIPVPYTGFVALKSQ